MTLVGFFSLSLSLSSSSLFISLSNFYVILIMSPLKSGIRIIRNNSGKYLKSVLTQISKHFIGFPVVLFLVWFSAFKFSRDLSTPLNYTKIILALTFRFYFILSLSLVLYLWQFDQFQCHNFFLFKQYFLAKPFWTFYS